MIRDGRDPDVIQNERRHGPRRERGGRRAADEAADMASHEDLRALVQAVRDRVREEREDRQRELDALRERIATLEQRTSTVTVALIRWSAVAAVVLGALIWFGPTRLANLIKALFGGP